MRKLLLILLLLFPIHGAWGETFLTCEYELGPTMYFIFDENKQIVTNDKGAKFLNVSITNTVIGFDTTFQTPKTKSMRYSINRLTGKSNIYIVMTDGTTGKNHGSCKKVSGKRKF